LFGDHVGVVLNYPRNKVLWALACWLWCRPQFEVFNSVVVSDAVDVMDVLKGV
jgi:hypothetical protein